MAGAHRHVRTPLASGEPRKWTSAEKWNAAAFFAEYGLILAAWMVSLVVLFVVKDRSIPLFTLGCLAAIALVAVSPLLRGKLRKLVFPEETDTGTGRVDTKLSCNPSRHRTA